LLRPLRHCFTAICGGENWVLACKTGKSSEFSKCYHGKEYKWLGIHPLDRAFDGKYVVIKIEPLFATDSIQSRALLRHQNEPIPYESFCAEEAVFKGGLMFWQHWLPCRWHIAPSIYVAKEDGVIIALISVASTGKARACWRIDHLVVHPHHRGRGIAQELLRYIFALFGSQGVSHFVIEVSCQNSAAFSLLGTCGFRRSARLTHFRIPKEAASDISVADASPFRLALPEDKQSLYQLNQDALPPDLRLIYDLMPEDFKVGDLPVEASDKIFKRLIKRKLWYWVSEDKERRVLTAAIKVTAHQEGDYHLEFIVHPGWKHLAKEAVSFALSTMGRLGMVGVITAKAYDYQPAIGEALAEAHMEKDGEFFLMTREHWLRAKKPRSLKIEHGVGLPSIGKPAINLPRNLKVVPHD
jgi:GNAT superfamily N-acetyltransferase